MSGDAPPWVASIQTDPNTVRAREGGEKTGFVPAGSPTQRQASWLLRPAWPVRRAWQVEVARPPAQHPRTRAAISSTTGFKYSDTEPDRKPRAAISTFVYRNSCRH